MSTLSLCTTWLLFTSPQFHLFVNVVIPCKVPLLARQHVHMYMLHSLPRLLAVLHSNGEGRAGMHLLEDWSNAVHTQEQVRHLITCQLGKALGRTNWTDQDVWQMTIKAGITGKREL